jgi:hypothetical protein
MKRTNCNLTIEQKMSESRSAQILCIVSSTLVSGAEFARLSTCCESDGYYLERLLYELVVFVCLFIFIFGVIRFTRCGDGASWGYHPHTVPLRDVARCVLFNVRTYVTKSSAATDGRSRWFRLNRCTCPHPRNRHTNTRASANHTVV